MKVTGSSELELEYGFSRFDAKNITTTTINPQKGDVSINFAELNFYIQNERFFLGYLNKLLIAIKKGGKLIKDFKNVEFIDMSGKILMNIPVKKINKYENISVYETDEFYPTDVLFNIKVSINIV